jgi:flagellar biogenesis protein FliO
MRYAKRNLPVIVILLALLLILFVIWLYNRRIERIDGKTMPATSKTKALNIQQSKQLQLTIIFHLKNQHDEN